MKNLLRRLLPTKAAACRRGATAVEFALIFPVFLAFVLGIIEVGRAMWIKGSLQYAVEETTRYAMVNTSASTSTLEAYATSKLMGVGVSSTGVTFQATQDTSGGTNYITITGSYVFQGLTSYLPYFDDVTLNAKSRVPLNS